MNLVIDASVIIKWFVDEIGSDEARSLLINERFRFCAPAHAFGAIGMALDLGASVYNALYIALAADLDTVFVTADVRLIRSMRGTGWHDRVLSVAAALR